MQNTKQIQHTYNIQNRHRNIQNKNKKTKKTKNKTKNQRILPGPPRVSLGSPGSRPGYRREVFWDVGHRRSLLSTTSLAGRLRGVLLGVDVDEIDEVSPGLSTVVSRASRVDTHTHNLHFVCRPGTPRRAEEPGGILVRIPGGPREDPLIF